MLWHAVCLLFSVERTGKYWWLYAVDNGTNEKAKIMQQWLPVHCVCVFFIVTHGGNWDLGADKCSHTNPIHPTTANRMKRDNFPHSVKCHMEMCSTRTSYERADDKKKKTGNVISIHIDDLEWTPYATINAATISLFFMFALNLYSGDTRKTYILKQPWPKKYRKSEKKIDKKMYAFGSGSVPLCPFVDRPIYIYMRHRWGRIRRWFMFQLQQWT